jgi:hypothetical protein
MAYETLNKMRTSDHMGTRVSPSNVTFKFLGTKLPPLSGSKIQTTTSKCLAKRLDEKLRAHSVTTLQISVRRR